MALKPVLSAEEHEELDESLQSHYTGAQDGNFHLDLDGEAPSVQRLEKALERWKDAAGSSDPRTVKKRLDEAKSIRETFGDLDPDEAKIAIERLEELESGEGDKDREDEIKRIREGLETKHQKELGQKDAVIERLTGHVERREVDQAIESALQKVGVIPQTREAVKALLRSRGPKVVWEDGSPRGVFTTELGEEIDISTYVEAWAKTDEAMAFLPSSGRSGSDATSGNGASTGGRKNPWKDDTLNLTEQGRILRSDPALAKQLARAAGKEIGKR